MSKHGTTRRFSRLAACALVAVTASAAGVSVSLTAHGASAATTTTVPLPKDDPFYFDPANIANMANGAIIRTRPIDATVAFLGLNVPLTSWQIAYKSLDEHNRPITDVTTILVPTAKYTGTAASRPLVSYQAAEDSTGSQCAPSYSLRTGSNLLTGQEQSLMALGLMKGFALALPDYEGPRSAYLTGVQAAHAGLDGIRAALQFSAAGLTAKTPVGTWGFSGGGHATAWMAELQKSYAPELTIAGTAFGGAPPDLASSFKIMDGGPFTAFAMVGLIGVSNGYPEWDVKSTLNAKGLAAFQAATDVCIADIGVSLAFLKLDDLTLLPNSLELPQNKAYAAKVNLGQNVPVAPIYDYYSTFDEAISTADSTALANKYCTQGVKVVRSIVAVSEHVTLGISKAPDALQFLEDRFAGKRMPWNTCLPF